MPQPTRTSTKTKAEQEAQQKALRRAEQANILAGVRPILEQEEQLLAFARARIAGGWRGKLNVGPEAFFAPYANVALTERRVIVQHVHHASGKPSEMLPHSYTLGAISRVTFTDIETFGGEPAGRLIVLLQNGLYVRLRLRGQLNCASAQNMVELFDSLTIAQRTVPTSPLQTTCVNCHRVLDQDYKFCPYCGTAQGSASGITLATDQDAANRGEAQEADPAAVVVPQETDFAYERGDQPAEFGIVVPLPDAIEPEPIETSARQEEAELPETGLTAVVTPEGTETTTEAQDEQADAPTNELNAVAPEDFAVESRFTPGEASAPMPGEPQSVTTEDAANSTLGNTTIEVTMSDIEGPRQTLEPDDLTTLDYPLSAEFDTNPMPTTETDAERASDMEFGQYDAQDYGELPFIENEEASVIEGQQQELEVASDNSDVVRDDISEAFAPHAPQNEDGNAVTENVGEHPDSFAEAVPQATGHENIDFNANVEATQTGDYTTASQNTGAAGGAPAENQTSSTDSTSPYRENHS